MTSPSSQYMTGKDMLLLPDGATYHLGVKTGEVHPRVLTVGAAKRANAIATLLDKTPEPKRITSSRDFTIISGHFKGTPVSIIAIGMGSPMMDFMIREATFVCPGPMAIIRLGTCGLFNPSLKPGTVCTAGAGASYVYINYAHFDGVSKATASKVQGGGCEALTSLPYVITCPVPCHKPLNELLVKALRAESSLRVHDGLNSCGETFYSCQGRNVEGFDDRNRDIVSGLMNEGVDFVDMETHQLFHLAKRRQSPCYAAAACIGIVNRTNPSIIENVGVDELHNAELKAGLASLQALVDFTFEPTTATLSGSATLGPKTPVTKED